MTAQFERWKKDLSNWGRWGKDDEIGALNLITPAKRKEAAGLVKEGFSVSLASDADTVKAVDNPNPYEHEMLAIGNDRFGVRYHGITHTHLDSLAHINDNGVFFNGYKPDRDTVLKEGHAKNSIHNLKNGIFTRGILLDIPRLKGVPYLEPGTPIYVEDLEAWEKKAGIRVSAGDALFVRTGVWARRKAVGPWLRGRAEGGRSAGLSFPWLKSATRGDEGPPPQSRAVKSTRLGPRFRPGRPWRASVRQLRSGSAGRRGRRAEPVAVPADGSAAADKGRHRIAAQPGGGVLKPGGRR